MNGRDFISERSRTARRWTYAPLCWFVLGVPIFGLLGAGVGSIIWLPGLAVVGTLVGRVTKQVKCPHCGQGLWAFSDAGFRYPISGRVQYFPCCRGRIDAALDHVGGAP